MSRAGKVFSRWIALAGLAVGGCLVSFEDYPVGDLDPDSGARGGSIGEAGAGGAFGSGAAGAGGSGGVDASTGGSSTGGSSTGGALGVGGSAGTASGAAGSPIDANPDSADVVSPCGNTTSDKLNCGRCGHDCCGGECVDAKCQPKEIYVGPDGGNAALEEIAVQGTNVYFSSTRLPGVMRVGSSAPIWNKKQRVTSIAVDNTGIYVAGTDEASSTGIVERVSLDGSSTQSILAVDDYPSELALDETYVYWRSGNSIINRWAKSGTTSASPLGASISGLGRFGVLSGFVYYQSTDGRIVQRDSQGGDHPLATGEAGVSSVTANAGFVFWSLTTAAKIRRIAVGGGAPIDLVTNAGAPTWVAADDNYVYWIANSPPSLRAAPVNRAESAIDLALDLSGPRKLALDARCVYVTEAGAPGKILRVAKP